MQRAFLNALAFFVLSAWSIGIAAAPGPINPDHKQFYLDQIVNQGVPLAKKVIDDHEFNHGRNNVDNRNCYYDGMLNFQVFAELYPEHAGLFTKAAEACIDDYLIWYGGPSGIACSRRVQRKGGYRRFAEGYTKYALENPNNKHVLPADIACLSSEKSGIAFAPLGDYVDSYDPLNTMMVRETLHSIFSELAYEQSCPSCTRQPNTSPRRLHDVAHFKTRLEVLLFWSARQAQMMINNVYQYPVRNTHFWQPFMTGQQMKMFIDVIEWERANGRDPNLLWTDPAPDHPSQDWSTIESALKVMWDELRFNARFHNSGDCTVASPEEGTKLWNDGDKSFYYIDRGSEEEGACGEVYTTPDLNMLMAIAPAWLCLEYSDDRYCDNYDELLEGIVHDWNQGPHGKQFNQKYVFGLRAMEYREAAAKAGAESLASEDHNREPQ